MYRNGVLIMINLELDTFDYEDNLEIGTLQIEQIENGTKIIIELFPNNQTKESFENAEFSKVYDILELALFHGYNLDFPVPEGTTEDQLTELSMSVFNGVDLMLESTQNIKDFKNVTVHSQGVEVPIYPVLEKLRKNYLLKEINSYLKYRADEDPISEDTDIDTLETLYSAIDTINCYK